MIVVIVAHMLISIYIYVCVCVCVCVVTIVLHDGVNFCARMV